MNPVPARLRSVFAATLVVAALLAAGCREQGEKPNGYLAVATVNGAPVTVETFARELAFWRRTSAGVLPQSPEGQDAFRRAALDGLIDRLVVLAAAREAGITVPAETVERELLKLKAEYHGADFNEALAEGQLSQQELRDRTHERLIVERYFVEEVFTRVAVTDPEIEAYYEEHADQFAQPEQVRAAQIVVKTADDARRVLAQLRKGMRFDEAARRFSLSPDAKIGGDLGYFRRGMMPQAFDQVCFSLGVGKVSDVVATEYGFHIFKVLDRRAADRRSLDRVRDEVEKVLLLEKQRQAQQRALARLREKAKVAVDEAALATVRL